MILTRYTLPAPVSTPITLALVCDLHNGRYEHILAAIENEGADAVCVAGDFLDRRESTARGFAFLAACARRYPTFVSLGNHEWKCKGNIRAELEKTGARLLDNDFVPFGELLLGGLSSGYEGKEQGRFKRTPDPETEWLEGYCARERSSSFFFAITPNITGGICTNAILI